MTMQKACLVWTAALALQFISLASGQVDAPTGSPQLRFVAQLRVNGCPLFVHDTRLSDGVHLTVEPIMCVMDSLQSVIPKVDLVTKKLYVSVPVVLHDAAMLPQVYFRLRNLGPRNISFATVTEVSATAGANSAFDSTEFIWRFGEPVGMLRLWCADKQTAFSLASRIKASPLAVLDGVALSATVSFNRASLQLKYRLVMQNRGALGPVHQQLCRQLRFVKIVSANGCPARVHQRLDAPGHFLIEPLLCHNMSSMSSESVKYDSARGMHYLKLDLVLQDDATLDAVRTQLVDLAPRSVSFMRLWRAQSTVSSALSARFSIGPLMVSTDWRSAQLRVFCGTLARCRNLRFILRSEPADFWRHVKWQVASSLVSDQCLLETDRLSSSWRSEAAESALNCSRSRSCVWLLSVGLSEAFIGGNVQMMDDGRMFVMIQQRLNGNVSFQRNWTEYEAGFGDETNFWIGLSAIHQLSSGGGGTTLRVEIKQWDGTEVHAEHAGFQVEDASANYRMTYHNIVPVKSNVTFSFMARSHEMQFTTMDADHDTWEQSCSSENSGNAGWWFKDCFHINPNGLYPPHEILERSPDSYEYQRYMVYYTGDAHRWKTIREVRLMLQI